MTAAQGGVLRLETPRDECRETACFFLQIVESLQMINAVFRVLSHTEHHGRGSSHADLVRRTMNIDPVSREAFQARNFVTDFVVKNFRTAAGDGIEAGVTQAKDSVPNAEVTVLSDGDDLGCRIAMQVNLRKALLDSAQHFFVPVNLQIGMQAALHEDAGTAKFDGLANLVVDCVEFEDVTFLCRGPLERAIKRAESAVFGAEIGVVNVAIDDVGDHALRVKLPANAISIHADADEVIGLEHLQSLLFGERHLQL